MKSSRIILHYKGKEYVGAISDEHNAEEFSEVFYNDWARLDKMKLTLNDGNILLIGEDVIKGGVFIFENIKKEVDKF